MDADTEERMLERVERAWHQTHDLNEIHRLAAEAPSLASAIYELLELLVDIERIATEPTVGRARLDGRVRRYLEHSGFATAASFATPSSSGTSSLVRNLRLASGMDVPSIAAALDVSTSFVVGLQDHIDRFPSRARQEIARRLQNLLGLTSDAVAAVLVKRSAPTAQRAARSTSGRPTQPASVSFEHFVSNTGLSPEQVAYWLSLQTDN